MICVYFNRIASRICNNKYIDEMHPDS